MYDDDWDSGDISTIPLSRSSPQLSSYLQAGPSEDGQHGQSFGPSGRSALRGREMSSPTPQRLLGKNLWAKNAQPQSQAGPSIPQSPTRAHGHGGLSVSSSASSGWTSDDDDSISGASQPDFAKIAVKPSPRLASNGSKEGSNPNTPLASTSNFWAGNQTSIPRPSSAALITYTSHTNTTGDQDDATPKNPRSYATTRTSSANSLTRSRSMNVHPNRLSRRLPSIDLSADTLQRNGDGSSAMSATVGKSTPSTRLGWHRRPGERPPPLVNPMVAERMGRWIKEIVVCNFDLERGPVVERRMLGRRWGPGEKENVAFSSFPDTSLFAEGSIQFSFKIRHIPPDPSTLSFPEPPSPMPDRTASPGVSDAVDIPQNDRRESSATLHPSSSDPSGSISRSTSPAPMVNMSTGQKAEEYRKWDERGREWLYGYVWFEQRRDGGIARGYMQKSLVILTHLPFPSLFAAVLHRVAPVFFEHGYSALEAACHSIASWPDPIPDTVLDIPILSDLITIKLPDMRQTPQVGNPFTTPSPQRPLLASLPSSTPLRTFASFLPSLWTLWECLILAEPVLVIAPDPRTCSEIVWWLRDLLRPLPPAGDFRPYLHIHDHDFSLLVNSNKPQPGVVVGVTNPFFRNAASHWPNVISIPAPKPKRIVSNPSGAGMGKVDQPEGFISKRHRSVSKDRPLLKRLEQLVAEGRHDDPAGNEALRTHFQQLTEKMLVPLNRYFQTLVPTISPSPTPSPVYAFGASTPHSALASSTASTIGSLKPFSIPAFVSHLKTKGPNPLSFRQKGLTTKSRVESDFYTTFCMSPTFAGWLSKRVESMGVAFAAAQSSAGVGHRQINLSVPSLGADPHGAYTRSPGATALGTGLGIIGQMGDLDLEGRRGSASGASGSVRLSSDTSFSGRSSEK